MVRNIKQQQSKNKLEKDGWQSFSVICLVQAASESTMINLMFNPTCCSFKESFSGFSASPSVPELLTEWVPPQGEEDDDELCPLMRGVVIGVLHSESSECCHQSKTLLGWIQIQGNLCLITERRVVYLETLSIVCVDIIMVYKTVIN